MASDVRSKLRSYFIPGGWLPANPKVIQKFINGLKKYVKEHPRDLVQPIQELQEMVMDPENTVLRTNFEAMFTDQKPPVGDPLVTSFSEFLTLLNAIMTRAPAYTVSGDELEPTGLIGFPINALLNWPMATPSGYEVFSNALVNQQFKRILTYWCHYLESEDSRYVLVEGGTDPTDSDILVLPWLGPEARKTMVGVAAQGEVDPDNKDKPFEYYYVCDPLDQYYGFKSWDDFFVRLFRDGVRPVASGADEIANACESAPLQQPKTNVQLTDKFWVKGQPYSMANMMNFHPLAEQFSGGTVYQAFLSALSYHRWHSPVKGIVRKAFVVSGSYYLENIHVHDDPVAPNDSQAFLTSVAARAVIFIEAENPHIGLMCFVAIGMAEVSSNEITVHEGQLIEKGEELGMFHFGGSTHCLVFRPGVQLEWDWHNTSPGEDATNIPVKSRIATVKY